MYKYLPIFLVYGLFSPIFRSASSAMEERDSATRQNDTIEQLISQLYINLNIIFRLY